MTKNCNKMTSKRLKYRHNKGNNFISRNPTKTVKNNYKITKKY